MSFFLIYERANKIIFTKRKHSIINVSCSGLLPFFSEDSSGRRKKWSVQFFL